MRSVGVGGDLLDFLGHLRWPNFYKSFVMCHTIFRSHAIINEFVQYLFIQKVVFFSRFQYSQVVQNTNLYKQLPWREYLTNISFKYILGEKVELTAHTYQIHNPDLVRFDEIWCELVKFCEIW